MVKSKTILIIEDESLLSEAYAMILKKEGFDTLEAHNGLEALEIIARHKVDLILLDLRMPKMNGIEFL